MAKHQHDDLNLLCRRLTFDLTSLQAILIFSAVDEVLLRYMITPLLGVTC